MRKLIYAINITLDGCCEHTKVGGSEETLDYYTQLLDEVDLFVYGRKTYQLMVPYWPDVIKDPSENEASIHFAKAFVSKNKVVFSRTLDSAEVEKEDGSARVVRGNVREEILKLKQEKGKPMLAGGVDIPSQLIEMGLVDEYRIVVAPAIGGEGRRLMQDVKLPENLPLKLVDTKVFDSGRIALRYAKA